MLLTSITHDGLAKRSFIKGMRLMPPDITLASPWYMASSCRTSSTVDGDS